MPGTLTNIRLLDPAVVSPTFRQLQQIRSFYAFPDALDVDRYPLDDGLRGAIIAVREVNLDGVGERNWANDHAVFTHGFGVVAAYDNTAGADGRPSFIASDVPVTGELEVEQPRIYFGEQSPDYSIVGGPEGSEPRELDFPDDTSPTGQRNNTYTGQGGVGVGNLFHKLLFAARFQDPNIILSSLVNSESKILFDREPVTRVAKVAPWLTVDGDPYPVVVDGRVKWIVDAYTTTSSYPYSSRTTLSDATADALTATTTSVVPLPSERINYLRNSVKAVVDAYDGTVTLYAWDPEEPMLQTWTRAFGGVVTPGLRGPRRAGGALPLPRGPVQGAAHDPGALPRRGPGQLLQRPGLLDDPERPHQPRRERPAAAVLPDAADARDRGAEVLADHDVRSAEAPDAGGVHVRGLRARSDVRDDPRAAAAPQHDRARSDAGAEQLRVRAGDRRAADPAPSRRGGRGVRQPAVAAGQRRDAVRGAGLRAAPPRARASRCCARCW